MTSSSISCRWRESWPRSLRAWHLCAREKMRADGPGRSQKLNRSSLWSFRYRTAPSIGGLISRCSVWWLHQPRVDGLGSAHGLGSALRTRPRSDRGERSSDWVANSALRWEVSARVAQLPLRRGLWRGVLGAVARGLHPLPHPYPIPFACSRGARAASRI